MMLSRRGMDLVSAPLVVKHAGYKQLNTQRTIESNRYIWTSLKHGAEMAVNGEPFRPAQYSAPDHSRIL